MLDSRIDKATANQLKSRGHRISWSKRTIADPVMLVIGGDGVVRAAGDRESGRFVGAVGELD